MKFDNEEFGMKLEDLTPSERLLCAIFGMPAEIKHWLSAEGEQALNEVLQDWSSKTDRPIWHERGLKIIRWRFGFEPREEDGKLHCRTLKEVGEYFGVTRERIRQMEAKALRQLRHPVYSNRLKPYLGGLKLLPHCTNDEAHKICLRGTPSDENCKGCPSWK